MTTKNTIERFFDEYLCKRSVQKAMAYISEEIICQGPGAYECIKGKDAFQKILENDIAVDHGKTDFDILDYEEVPMDENIRYVYFRLKVGSDRTKIRMTAVLRQKKQKWKVACLHGSVPVEEQKIRDILLRRSGAGAGERSNILQDRQVTGLLYNSFPCGIIGRYLENGFPLYTINDELLSYLGYEYSELLKITGGKMINLVVQEDREQVEQAVFDSIRKNGKYEIRYRCRHKKGGILWLYDIGRTIIVDEDREAIISIVLEVSDAVKNEEKLEYEAAYDALTNVRNRKGGVRFISKCIEEQKDGILFSMDIDNFKKVNDTYGHRTGDEVLRQFAKILAGAGRQDDIAVRMGGDEFLLYFSNLQDTHIAEKKARCIQKSFADAIARQYSELRLSVSIGAARKQEGDSFGRLYQRADEALYRAKKSGRGKYIMKD